MKKYNIVFRPLAEADLSELYEYIAEQAGVDVAGSYVERIEDVCNQLEMFPERGTRRDDIRRGLRTIGFEKRVTIAFQVKKDEVVIIRIFYGGRDYEHILRGAGV